MFKFFRLSLQALCLIGIITYTNACFAGMASLSDRYDVHQYINGVANQYNFDAPWLARIFNHAELRPELLKMIKAPKEGIPWYRYRALFITPKRVQLGVEFWNKHEKMLEKAQREYGVPADIIVAIIGVETQYGQYTGKYRVIDTLTTLAFDGNSRRSFFRSELTQYLLLTRDQSINPLAIRGSYAGAIGVPQFMPSSYRTFAVSAEGNGSPDLIRNPDDAILSVANYFKQHGWQRGEPVAIPAAVTGNQYQNFINGNLKPQYTLKQLEKKGIKPSKELPKNMTASLIRLQDHNNDEYWLGFNNFYVISLYNASFRYSMAVYQLAEEISKAKENSKHS